MHYAQFKEIMLLLNCVFSNFDDVMKINTWYAFFENTDYEQIYENTLKWIKENNKPPTIADLLGNIT